MSIRNALPIALAATALSVPALSFATSVWHTVPSEVGVTFHPDHIKSSKSRTDVQKELQAARRDGSLFLLQRGIAVPQKDVTAPKTREQVLGELHSMSAEEKRQQRELYYGG